MRGRWARYLTMAVMAVALNGGLFATGDRLAAAQQDMLGQQWHICEGGIEEWEESRCGVWTRQGGGETWVAAWDDGMVSAVSMNILGSHDFTASRQEPNGQFAQYAGSAGGDIIVDGELRRYISGTVTICCDGQGDRSWNFGGPINFGELWPNPEPPASEPPEIDPATVVLPADAYGSTWQVSELYPNAGDLYVSGEWTRLDDTGRWLATWDNGNVSIVDVTIYQDGSFAAIRSDSSIGSHATYFGTVEAVSAADTTGGGDDTEYTVASGTVLWCCNLPGSGPNGNLAGSFAANIGPAMAPTPPQGAFDLNGIWHDEGTGLQVQIVHRGSTVVAVFLNEDIACPPKDESGVAARLSIYFVGQTQDDRVGASINACVNYVDTPDAGVEPVGIGLTVTENGYRLGGAYIRPATQAVEPVSFVRVG